MKERLHQESNRPHSGMNRFCAASINMLITNTAVCFLLQVVQRSTVLWLQTDRLISQQRHHKHYQVHPPRQGPVRTLELDFLQKSESVLLVCCSVFMKSHVVSTDVVMQQFWQQHEEWNTDSVLITQIRWDHVISAADVCGSVWFQLVSTRSWDETHIKSLTNSYDDNNVVNSWSCSVVL